MLEVQNLVKKYDGVIAVDDISFIAKPGQIFGLLGPNGAGKTTTMRMILNIIKPSAGRIIFENKKSLSELSNIVGYLPEERGLYKKSKVIDLILYFAVLKNMEKKTARIEAFSWLNRLAIEELANRKIEELSKGNQQKIQFITAIIHKPDILILDEPFTGFDPINQQEIKNIILDYTNSGKIIILSTHQMDTAEKLCSEIFLINKGKEVCSGNLSDIKKKFGGQHIKLKFEGDTDFITREKDVLHYDIFNNFIELQLKDGIKPSDFLKSIIEKINITHFSVIEPSLNKIFIDLVKQSSDKIS
ncbi:MAG: ATP-binding cassette domain-containing protein [Ignavibacteriaceae bacterium]